MDLFDLFIKIGVNDQASSHVSELSDKLSNGLKVAAGIGTAAVSAASAAVVALTKNAVKNYAEYEQLVGGVETLFKNNAQNVQDYAAGAYKTAGMSANDYMSLVTSFSASLLQSLENDTEAASEYANRAIIDMSDNANKMGTDISMIQNAYQGFAKQNYTMLDNLKLGYGGTKGEMERLIADANAVKVANGEMADLTIESFADVVEAIHIVQTEMGITGTTAKEAASTISGSSASAKAAWQNLLTGIADDNADMEVLIGNFVGSVEIAGRNILPRIEIALNGAGELIDRMFPILLDKVPEIISGNLPKMTESAVNIIRTLVDGLKNDENQDKIGQAAKDTVITLLSGAKSLLPDVLDLGLDLVLYLANGIADNSDILLPEAVGLVLDLVDKILEPETLLSLVDAAIAIVTGLADGVVNSTDILIDKAPEIIGDLVYSLIRAIPMLQEASDETIDKLTEYLTSPETAIKLVGAALEIIIRFVQGIIDNKKKSFEAAKSVFNEFKTGILSFIDSPFEWGKDLIDNFIGGIKSKMNSLKDTVKNVAQSIKDLIGFSEPKEGPLSNFHTYAPDMIDLFIKGVRDNEGRLRDQIATSFDFGKQTITAGYDVSGGAGSNGGGKVGGVTIIQNIYSKAQTAADLMQEAQWEAERAVLFGV